MAKASRGSRRAEDDARFRALLDEAKSRHNLSDIIGRYTKLKRRGSRELVGLCPFHPEKSPSFEVNDDKGTYHCWGCGAGGDAIRFLMIRDGMEFRAAIETLTGEDFPVVAPEERARRKQAQAAEFAQRLALAREIWSRTTRIEGTIAEFYAREVRGITAPIPSSIRFVMTPRWRNADTGEVGRDHPAMACALQARDGAIVGVQCVFLQNGGREKYARDRPDGTKAKAKLSFGNILGSALRLGPVSDEIVVCEGPEDGLSLMQGLPGRSVWVACGTALMSRLELPPEVRAITLAGDNNAAGRLAVEQSRAAYVERGLSVREIYPSDGFKDWNDELRGVRA